jgi:hypothetical protein
MRNGRYVPDSRNVQSGTLQGADCRLAAAAWTLDVYFYLTEAVYHSFPGGVAGCHLSRVGCAFAGALETGRAGASPGQGIPLRVREGYDGIIEAGLYISPAGGDRFPFPPPRFYFSLLWHPVLLVPVLLSLLLGGSALLASAGNCLRLAFLGACVSACALAPGGQPVTVAVPAVAADLDKPLDIAADFFPQLAFHAELFIYDFP